MGPTLAGQPINTLAQSQLLKKFYKKKCKVLSHINSFTTAKGTCKLTRRWKIGSWGTPETLSDEKAGTHISYILDMPEQQRPLQTQECAEFTTSQ